MLRQSLKGEDVRTDPNLEAERDRAMKKSLADPAIIRQLVQELKQQQRGEDSSISSVVTCVDISSELDAVINS